MDKKILEFVNEFYVDQAVGPPVAMSEEEIDHMIRSYDHNIEVIRSLRFLKEKDLIRVSEGIEMFITSLTFRMLNINRVANRYKNDKNNNN